MNTSDLKLNEPDYILMKGQPKTGKSIAAHSYQVEPCDMYPSGLKDTYTLSFDHRMQSIKSFYPNRNFEYDEYSTPLETNRRLDALKSVTPGRMPYGAVIFDGLTKYSNIIMEAMIAHRLPNQKSDSKTIRAGIPMAEIEDYGGEFRALTMALNSLLAIHVIHKIHVILIAHVIETEYKNMVNNTTRVTRELLTAGKKIAASLPTDFNEAYHFYAQSDPMSPDDKPVFKAVTTCNSIDWAATVKKLPASIDWTNKNFYSEIRKCLAGNALFT